MQVAYGAYSACQQPEASAAVVVHNLHLIMQIELAHFLTNVTQLSHGPDIVQAYNIVLVINSNNDNKSSPCMVHNKVCRRACPHKYKSLSTSVLVVCMMCGDLTIVIYLRPLAAFLGAVGA